LARGFAIGIFWGMFPLPGVQMLIAAVTAAFFRGSKVAAIAATWLGNPLTTLPLTALNFHVGQTLLGRTWTQLPQDIQTVDGFLKLGGETIAAYLLGCFVMGVVGGILSYILGIPIVAFVQKRANRRPRKVRYNKRAK
jgi:uncharacterized protein